MANIISKSKDCRVIELRSKRNLPEPENLKSLTITLRGRTLTVNLGYAVDREPLPSSNKIVGIDMGVTDRMTLSDSAFVSRRGVDRTITENALRRRDRCKRGSREYRKRNRVIANAHRRQAIRNRNECHRITTGLIRDYGLVAVEKLQIPNMTRSAKGTVAKPCKKVAQKSGLNRSIAEQTW